MPTIILDGKEVANNILSSVKTEAKNIAQKLGRPLKLSIVSVGERKDSKSYIKSKLKKAESLGFDAENIALPDQTTQSELENVISQLSNDSKVDGIILQLPIPKNLNAELAIEKITFKKDLDGLTLHNRSSFAIKPCTPLGVLKLIETAFLKLDKDLSGQHAVIVGRSELVGKPTADLLLKKNCTVTICHSKTKNLEKHISEADILVVAIGKANFIKSVKKGAVVIDVGINHADHKIVGDVDFEVVKSNCSAITPVPGGVGPMTVAMLMLNLINATKLA